MYSHKVHYYETDKMGITHHSNYIRWMEEARIDFLHEIGWDFDRLESEGIVSPVVSVNCSYKLPTVFAQNIDIEVKVVEFKGVKLILGYQMYNDEGKCVCEGTSVHAFMDREGRPLRLKKEFPDFFETLTKLVESE